MGRDLRVPACRERGLQRIAPRGEGVSPSPVPSPNGDSHHGPLQRDRPGEEPDLEPHTDTASHWVSPRTAPAPWGWERLLEQQELEHRRCD